MTPPPITRTSAVLPMAGILTFSAGTIKGSSHRVIGSSGDLAIEPYSERASYRRDKIRNPKLEIRNNVKCPKFKTQNTPASKLVRFRGLEIRILNLFRISK